jgi:predicted SprT family Zn-dependent metalloprotease
MKRHEAAAMMTRLMTEFGLTQQGWSFRWMTRKKTLGLCQYFPKYLLLSTSFVDLNDEDVVEQVCRHEIAHALAGVDAGHGPVWQATAIQCGVRNPSSKCSEAVVAKGRYQATCPTCSTLYTLHRRPKVKPGLLRYCPKCWKSGAHKPKPERIAGAELIFTDTRTVTSTLAQSASLTPVRTTVSAQQSAPAVTPQANIAGAVYSASELAAAMRVDAKSFRAWLRRNKQLQWDYQKPDGRYEFPGDKVSEIVRLWNREH